MGEQRSGDDGAKLRFIVDAMLGDLARWLRMLGYDTIYDRNMPDWKQLEIAAEQGRILLTRDRGLYIRARKRGIRSLLVHGDNIVDRLYTVAKTFKLRLEIDPDNTRCPLCNTPLRRVDKSEVRGRVPPKVYERHDTFWICSGCGQVYWRGGHWRGIIATLEEVKRRMGQRSRATSPTQTR
ncbi:MAG TPA: hypothetical protein EYH08_06235 [Pyrodictium sp.]|nr:hypothetical protein [Pyrodictium sp.]